MECAQHEDIAEARFVPSLSTAARALSDDGFASAFGGATTDWQTGEAQCDVAHSVFVASDIGEVLPEFRSLVGGQSRVTFDEPAFDAIDCAVPVLEGR